MLAVAEAVTELLIFGANVSKLVSRRQEQLLEEIHRISFENRLGRLRTNLHLALSELQSVALECAAEQRPPERVMARIESVTMVLAGELRSLHDLLYRPQEPLDAAMLESILATMAEALRHLGDLVASGRDPSPMLAKDLANVRRLAAEICGDCVPHEHASELKVWMDRVHQLGGRLEGTSRRGEAR